MNGLIGKEGKYSCTYSRLFFVCLVVVDCFQPSGIVLPALCPLGNLAIGDWCHHQLTSDSEIMPTSGSWSS